MRLQQTKALFAQFDKDGSGTISLNEFLEGLRVCWMNLHVHCCSYTKKTYNNYYESVCTPSGTCAYIYVSCTHVHPTTHTLTLSHICTHTPTHPHMHTHTHTHTPTHAHTHPHTHTCTHTHTHAHTHTYTHIHTHCSPP